MTLLIIDALRVKLQAVEVLRGISLTLRPGEMVGLVGRNGAGKTTTLRALTNMVKTRGDVVIGGTTIATLATEDIVRLGVAHVPDGRGTFLDLSTEENLRLGAFARKGVSTLPADIERMYGYFPRLKERRRQQAGTLSGGEQQMLAIARALMLRPRLLLLDEPSFGLAPLVVVAIFDILRAINRDENVAILLVEQNAALALELADHAYLLETGRIVIEGEAAAMRNDAAIRRAYLGY